MKEKNVTVISAPGRPGRQVWVERLREAYPDRETDYDDDEAFYSTLDEYARGRDRQIENYKASNRELADLFLCNPEAGAFLSALMEGSDVMTAIGECFGDYFETALKDPAARENYRRGMESRRRKEKELEEIQQRQRANAERNVGEVEAFIASKGLDEEGRRQFEDFISTLIDRVFLFDLDTDTLERLWRAMNYDRDVEEARSEGETMGRNAKIELEKRSVVTDGTPSLRSESRGLPAAPPLPRVRRSIWD